MLDVVAGTGCGADACGFGAADAADTLGAAEGNVAADVTEGAGLAAAAVVGLELAAAAATVAFGAAAEAFGGAAALIVRI